MRLTGGRFRARGGDAYVSANPTGGQIVFRMTPERWLSVDYSKVYG